MTKLFVAILFEVVNKKNLDIDKKEIYDHFQLDIKIHCQSIKKIQ